MNTVCPRQTCGWYLGVLSSDIPEQTEKKKHEHVMKPPWDVSARTLDFSNSPELI